MIYIVHQRKFYEHSKLHKICMYHDLLTGTVTDVRETVLTSEGVRDNIELAPEVVRDKFRDRGIPPLATISSTSPLVCCSTPIAC